MSLRAAASGLVVFLLSVSVIQGQDDWGVTYTSTEICALEASTVEITCSYRYPARINDRDTKVEETIWFVTENDDGPVDLRTQSQYAGRVENHCGKNDCTLRITDVRERDAAEFKFMFTTNQPGGRFTGSAGVNLTVTALQAKVIGGTLFSGFSRVELECHSSCSPAANLSYVWFRKGKKIQHRTSSLSDMFHAAESISCALEGLEDFPSPPECGHGYNCFRVTYRERNVCAFKGSLVHIYCFYDVYEGEIKSKFWFNPERSRVWQNPSQPEDLSKDSQYAGRVQVTGTNRDYSVLIITNLTERDSAQYHFKFKTQNFEWRSSLAATTLTVTVLQVQLSRVTVHQFYTEAELKCLSSCSPATYPSYVWFKNGEKIKSEEKSIYKGRFNPGDKISCAVRGFENFRSPSVYAPKLPSVSVSPSAEIVEGSSVTLTCSSDANPAANYTWYKENKDSPKASGQIFNITDFRAEHSGNYSCEAQNEIGRQISTISLTLATRNSTIIIIVVVTLTLLVLILILILLLCRWIRKRKTLDSTEPVQITKNVSKSVAAAKTDDTEEQENLM